MSNSRRETLPNALKINREERYYSTSIPSAHDEQIIQICHDLNAEGDYESARASLIQLHDTLLPVFCERMAVLAVRRLDEGSLIVGLRAAALASKTDDMRNVIVALSLLWRSAELIEVSPAQVFRRVATDAGDFGDALSSFAAREPKDQNISAMGYSAHGEGEAFTYRCDWESRWG